MSLSDSRDEKNRSQEATTRVIAFFRLEKIHRTPLDIMGNQLGALLEPLGTILL